MNRLRRSRREAGVTLIEMVMVVAIMGVVSTLILGIWFALSRSYYSTAKSAEQVDLARQALGRMSREIRDAQGVMGGSGVPVPFVMTYSNEIRFYSTFNTPGAATPGTSSVPRLTRYIYRVTDTAQGTGSIYRDFPGADGLFDTGDDVSTVVVSSIANARAGRDVFVYWAYNSSTGNLYHSSGSTVVITPSQLVTVNINLLVDMNPGRAPVYTDVATTVNPRNVRQF